MDHHTIPILQEQHHDAAAVRVGINDLVNSSSKRSVNEICDDIIKIALIGAVTIYPLSLYLVLLTASI